MTPALPLPRLIGAVLVAALLGACSKPEPAAPPVRAVRTIVIAEGSAQTQREYAAEVRPRTESRLAFRVPGKMTRRLVDLGDSVKKGQVLAQLDPRDLQLGQQAAGAAVQAAQVTLDLAVADLNRYRELLAQGFISGAEVQRRETAVKSAEAQLAQAKAQANVQGNQAGYSTLVADASGVITGIDAEPGAVVAAGTPVLRLARDGPRDAVFSVPEDSVAEVRALLDKSGVVQVKGWGDGQASLPAVVREIAAAADPVTRTFLVKADIGQAPLRLGQTATVTVPRPRRDDITKLPLTAVFEHEGQSAVWVVDPQAMTVARTPIKVAGADGNSVVVTAGLQPGQRVVIAGVHVLTPGQKVTLYAPTAAPAASAAPAAGAVNGAATATGAATAPATATAAAAAAAASAAPAAAAGSR